MGHPDIRNGTPFAFEAVHIADEELRPLVVLVVKATFGFDSEGNVWLTEDQIPVNLAGEPSTDAPVSSYKYEPEVAPWKAATDVVLIGHAQPAEGGATRVDVGIRVGPVQKVAAVFGDRYWVKVNQTPRMSRTAPVEQVPLIWENAFGGRDESRSMPERPSMDPRNPVGSGFGTPLKHDNDRVKLPSIEDPGALIEEYGAVVTPCGFGFTSPNWQPRASLAGTYDEEWSKTRKPMLPIDFDRRFFNAAAPGLVAPGYLRGDEEVVMLNVASVPRLAFRLPCIPPPRCRILFRGRREARLQTQLDTVIVNADDERLILIWRASAPTASGPHDVVAMEIAGAD